MTGRFSFRAPKGMSLFSSSVGGVFRLRHLQLTFQNGKKHLTVVGQRISYSVKTGKLTIDDPVDGFFPDLTEW